MTGCAAKGRAWDFVYFHISQAFDTVSHSILVAKLEMWFGQVDYRVDRKLARLLDSKCCDHQY